MDEYEHVEYLTKLVGEAHDLAVKLGVTELSDSHTLDDLYIFEKEYRVRARALRRLLRRVAAQQDAEHEMTQTDADKRWLTKHRELTEKFIREQSMTRPMASAAAAYVVTNLRKQEEDDESVN
jgi:hypothetical protein